VHPPRRETRGGRGGARVGRRLVPVVLATLLVGVAGCGLYPPGAARTSDTRIGVALITKDSTNPYFVAMQEGARRGADEYGVRLTVASGSGAGDVTGQVEAIEAAVARGDRGIVITPVSAGVDDAITDARLAGLYVIALDTPPKQPDLVDITFASDNREAGRLLGAWVAGRLAGAPARVAMVGLFDDGTVTVDRDRDQGFLDGMGIDLADPATVGDEAASGEYADGSGTYDIVCRASGGGTRVGGRLAMAECLDRGARPGVVYAVNEPTAFGVLEELDARTSSSQAGPAAAAGPQDDVVVVTVDGSCAGVAAVRDGRLGAVVQQDPVEMASLGVGSIARIARGGVKPSTTQGLGFRDTGVELVTDLPVAGVPSVDTDNGAATCWGRGA
jgi:fructose transport system substrate-binding protein